MLTSRFLVVRLPRRDWKLSSNSLLLAACGFVLLTPVGLFIDFPVARFCLADRIPGDIQRILTWSEVVAHGLGIAIVAGSLFVLDPIRRRFIPRLMAGALGAGLFADAMKLIVARLRPRHLELETGVWETFAGWMPIVFPIDGVQPLDSRWLSFPSGHTAVAVAFAIGLARIYPHGRWLFYLFAILAACQRIEVGAHYVSDTLAGAAIGTTFMLFIAESRLFGHWFDRIEQSSEPEESISVLD